MIQTATTDATDCHNRCYRLPQQMLQTATTDATDYHNRCYRLPQQMLQTTTTDATDYHNRSTVFKFNCLLNRIKRQEQQDSMTGLEVASMKVTGFWGIAPCSLVEVD
jgi:hypothetical protein